MADEAEQAGGDPAEDGTEALFQGMVRLARQLDRPVTDAEARAAAPAIEPGQEEAGLLRLAERLGFTASIVPATKRTLRDISPPCLLIGDPPGKVWLLRGRTGNHLILVDAVTGTPTASTPAAAAELASRVLLLEPEGQAGKAPTWRRTLLRRVRPVLWQVGLASVVINLLALATPLFMMTVYNKVINHGALRTLDVLAIGMVSLFVFELVLRTVRGYVTAHTGARLDAALGSDAVHHLLRLPFRSFEQRPASQTVERLRQLDQIRQFLSSHLPLLVVDLAFVGLFLVAILWLSPTLAAVTAAAIPLFVLASVVAQRRQGRLLAEQFKAGSAKNAALSEAVSSVLTVKALGLEPEMEARFERRLVDSAWAGFRAATVGHAVGSIGQGLQQITALVVVYLGARMIIAGEASVGALVACSILSARALAPMRQIAQAFAQLQQTRQAFQRLDSLLAAEPETAGARSAELSWRGHLRLEQVSFRYAEGRPPALVDVSLEVTPGAALGIVGAPGSGKSTLVKLLLGLERPASGRVLLDDVDLARIAPADFRGRVGVVPQEVQLFAGTIAENIAIGAAARAFARVVAAARFTGAHDFIQRLPDGYETVLGERGSGLSLGQRQLVAIARALVRNPRILILDEATSALDPAAEAYLLANLKRAGSGRTLVIVTHRPSVLAICDRAVMLEQGVITASGTPAEVTQRARAASPARPTLQAVS